MSLHETASDACQDLYAILSDAKAAHIEKGETKAADHIAHAMAHLVTEIEPHIMEAWKVATIA